MSTVQTIPILPYSLVVGQDQIRLALELAYIAPAIGGVLISGQRGTGKSTAVRAFSQMMYGQLPVTLPINATEDRVVGGWHIDRLLDAERISSPEGLQEAKQPGLLEQARGKVLFIDEVNLLDDHIVNIILDVTATGVLVIQREERNEQLPVSFTLVGTMNPEEGGLRPQLLDRFGLVVSVKAETENESRISILRTVMEFDRARRLLAQGSTSDYLDGARRKDAQQQQALEQARQRFDEVEFPHTAAEACIRLAQEFNVVGHRADYVLALAAKANAARSGDRAVDKKHIQEVAPMAIMHRRPEIFQHGREMWSQIDDERLHEILSLD